MMKSKLKRYLFNTTTLLTFFPFFKVLPIVAEIQPVGAALAIVYILAFDLRSKKRRELYRAALPYLAVMLAYLIGAIYFYEIGKPLELSFIVQSLAIFLAPFSIFLLFIHRITNISLSVFRFSIYSWFTISILQAVAPGILRATGIAAILGNIIDRFASETVGTGRGVAAFSPEPSYAAHIILLMLGIAILFYRRKILRKTEFMIMLVMSLLMAAVNQSGTIGFFIAVFGASYGLSELCRGGGKTFKALMAIVVIILGGGAIASMFPQVMEIRFFTVLSSLVNSIFASGGGQGFNAIEFSDSFGSVRGSAVQVGYESLSLTNGFGLGLGGWGSYSVALAAKTKVAEVSQYLFVYGDTPIRPYAYASFVAFDMGLMGLLSLSYMFLAFLSGHIIKTKQFSSFAFACFWVFFLGVYYNQPTSLAAHWLFLAIILEDNETKMTGQKKKYSKKLQ